MSPNDQLEAHDLPELGESYDDAESTIGDSDGSRYDLSL